MKIGTDIVKISKIANLDEHAKGKIFHKTELKSNPESLAGIFAAKEACKKVFNNLNWLDIEIKKKKNGKPILILNNKHANYDLSISHDGDYAIAVFITNE